MSRINRIKEEISEVLQEKDNKLEIAMCIFLWLSIIFAKHLGKIKNKNRGGDEEKKSELKIEKVKEGN